MPGRGGYSLDRMSGRQKNTFRNIVTFLGGLYICATAWAEAPAFPDLRLFHHSLENQTGGLIAPAPMSDLLMFLYLGSSGTTEAQFHKHLFPAFPRDGIGDRENLLVKDQPGFRSLSAWWVDPQTTLAPPFLEQGVRKWGIAFHSHNFGDGILETTQEVNKWFSTRTNNRVPQVLTPLDLTGRETVVAVTVSAFAGRWRGFDERDTAEERFHFSEQEKGNVSMMKSKGWRAYAENENFQALSLSFTDTNLNILFLLPRNPPPGMLDPMERTGCAGVGDNERWWGSVWSASRTPTR